MNTQIIKKCIDKNELQLSNWNKINHYWSVVFALTIPIWFIINKTIDLFEITEIPSQDGDIYVFAIPISLSFCFIYCKRKGYVLK